MKRALSLALLLAAAGTAGLHAAEVEATVAAAYEAFLQGRLEDSASAFRYLITLGIAGPDPDSNLALLARDQGQGDVSLPLWVRSSLRESADGFIWVQRGWAHAALDRPKEAREAFMKAIEKAATTADQGEAKVGLGVVALMMGQPKGAMAPLRDALVAGPYVIPAAAYQTALTALASRDKNAALAYLRQCISLDPLNLECLKALGRLQADIGENRAAWRVFLRILALDPQDAEALKETKRLREYVTASLEDSQGIRRLSRPLLAVRGDIDPAPSSATLRVALFSDAAGQPATVTQLYFMANSGFELHAALTGEVVKEEGRGNDQWEVIFRPETNIVEVRDNARNLQYTAKQPFRIVPSPKDVRRGSVLLKSAKFVEATGFDPGDRELRGITEIIPTPYGFKVVNDVNLEDYLQGVTGALLPQGSPGEAYKAQAVLSRTRALWYKKTRPDNQERSDICDSTFCQRYLGLNEEMRDSTASVLATRGWILAGNDEKPAKVLQHENCGGATEAGAEPGLEHLLPVQDGEKPAATTRTPVDLERWVHQFPPRDRYCEAGGLTAASQSRWMRLLDAKDLKARAERTKFIGAIKTIKVTSRTAAGRVRGLEVTGTRDAIRYDGDKAVAAFLSPNSLRSMWFTIQPLMNGEKATRFLLWGAGTGHGLGLCTAGEIGQAALGRSWQNILSHYFPGLKLFDMNAPKLKPAAAEGPRGPGRYRKPLNPRRKK